MTPEDGQLIAAGVFEVEPSTELIIVASDVARDPESGNVLAASILVMGNTGSELGDIENALGLLAEKRNQLKAHQN